MKLGDPIYYYQNLASGIASHAIVVAIHSPLLINLITWDGNRYVQKTSVHHKDDEFHQKNPEMAQRQGAWSMRDEEEDMELMLSLEKRSAFKKPVPAKV